MEIGRALTSIKAGVGTAIGTVSSGVGTLLEKIPTDIGKLATLVGIVLSLVMIYAHVRRLIMDIKTRALDDELKRIALLEKKAELLQNSEQNKGRD